MGLAVISRLVAMAGNVGNSVRLTVSGAIKVAAGTGLTDTGVGAPAGVPAVAWGLWNLKGAHGAWERAQQETCDLSKDIANNNWGWDSRNLLGVLPFGTNFDDGSKPNPIDVAQGIARNLAGNPAEFTGDLAQNAWNHLSYVAGQLASASW